VPLPLALANLAGWRSAAQQSARDVERLIFFSGMPRFFVGINSAVL
jgi:hypothetical protein